MSSYCLECCIISSINPKVSMVKQWYYQNVQYVVVKNQDSLRSKKRVEY